MTTPTETRGASHTPGTWRWSTIGLHKPERLTLLAGEREVAIVELRDLRDYNEANARLIAAAPELLEVLEDILEQAQIAVQRLNDALKADARTPGNAPFYISRLQRAFASIARAKGTHNNKEPMSTRIEDER